MLSNINLILYIQKIPSIEGFTMKISLFKLLQILNLLLSSRIQLVIQFLIKLIHSFRSVSHSVLNRIMSISRITTE